MTRPALPRDLAPNPLRLLPEQCGLAVIDVQERLAAAMPEEPLRRHVAKMVLLVEAARRFGLPVLVTEQYPRGLGRTIPVLAEALKRVSSRD